MKTTFRIATIIMALTIVNASEGFSQKGKFKDRKEQLKVEKKDFINRWCGFTDSESQKFWNIYDEMDDKLSAIRKERRKSLQAVKKTGIENMSESELKKVMDDTRQFEQKELDIRWEYHNKFVELVGVRKTARYYEGTRMFKRQLLERYRESRDEEDDD